MAMTLEIRDGVRRDNYLELRVTPPPAGIHWPVFDEQGLHHLALPLQEELSKWNPFINLEVVPKSCATGEHYNNYWLKATLEGKKLIVGITDNVSGKGRSHGWPHVYINSPPKFMANFATAVRAALQQCVRDHTDRHHNATVAPAVVMPQTAPLVEKIAETGAPVASPIISAAMMPLLHDSTTDATAQTPLPPGWHVRMDAAKESLVWVEESTGTVWEQFGLPEPPHLPWWWTESQPTKYQLTRPWEAPL
jgi:hypothetical protein